MSFTNHTPNYDLPQFVDSDKPSWLSDINFAFLKIDTTIATIASSGSGASADATAALNTANQASQLAQQTATQTNKNASDIAEIKTDVETLSETVTTTSNDVSSLKTWQTSTNSTITTLQTSTNQNTAEINALSPKIPETKTRLLSNIKALTGFTLQYFTDTLYGPLFYLDIRINGTIPANTNTNVAYVEGNPLNIPDGNAHTFLGISLSDFVARAYLQYSASANQTYLVVIAPVERSNPIRIVGTTSILY